MNFDLCSFTMGIAFGVVVSAIIAIIAIAYEENKSNVIMLRKRCEELSATKPEKLVICPSCEGTGHVWDTLPGGTTSAAIVFSHCDRCNGTGKMKEYNQ